jgi:hypothetical protein
MSKIGKEAIDCNEWTLEMTNNDTDESTNDGTDDDTQGKGSNSTNCPLLEVP